MDEIDKFLARIPTKHRKQLLNALDCLSNSKCRSSLHAEKLGGSKALYRARVGRYRIIFHINEHNEAVVDDIRLRNERTYRDI